MLSNREKQCFGKTHPTKILQPNKVTQNTLLRGSPLLHFVSDPPRYTAIGQTFHHSSLAGG